MYWKKRTLACLMVCVLLGLTAINPTVSSHADSAALSITGEAEQSLPEETEEELQTGDETSEETEEESSPESTSAEEESERQTTAAETTAAQTEAQTEKQSTTAAAAQTTAAAETTAATTASAQKNVIVVLDAGHGGSQPGAIYNGVYEKNINLTLALYVQQYLSEYDGIEVYMTRTTDVTLSSDLATDLYNRVAVGASVGADFVISLHCNASTSSAVSGSEVYIPVTEPYHTICQNMAGYVLGSLSETGLTNRGTFSIWDTELNREYYAICRHGVNMGIPSLIIEHAFMSNASDFARLTNDTQLRLIAQADAKGIAAYFGLTKNGQAVTVSYNTGASSYQGVTASEEEIAQQAQQTGKSVTELMEENAQTISDDELKRIQNAQMMDELKLRSLFRRRAMFAEWNRIAGSEEELLEALLVFTSDSGQSAQTYLDQNTGIGQ